MDRSKRVVLYLIIAFSISFYFKVIPPTWFTTINSSFVLHVSKGLLIGMGPLLGALVAFRFFKEKREISILGTDPLKSMAMVSLPILLLTLHGIPNEYGFDPHFMGFILSGILMIYAFLEEYGWRGYLQGEFKKSSPFTIALITGSAWYLWHWWFITSGFNFTQIFIWATLIFASYGIYGITQKTKSVLAAAAFHSLGNIFLFYQMISSQLSFETRIIILSVCILFWSFLIKHWNQGSLSTQEPLTV